MIRAQIPEGKNELPAVFRGSDRSGPCRTALSRLRGHRANRRRLPARHLAFQREGRGNHRLVLQRLSRHGPESRCRRRAAGRRRPHGLGRRRHAQHFRHQPSAGRAGTGTRRPARQGSSARLHLGLRLQRGVDLDHRPAAAQLPDDFRRTQPCLDDRGRAPLGRREEDLPPQRRRASRKHARRGRSRTRQADRLRERLFDGRRHLADRARSPTSPKNTTP